MELALAPQQPERRQLGAVVLPPAAVRRQQQRQSMLREATEGIGQLRRDVASIARHYPPSSIVRTCIARFGDDPRTEIKRMIEDACRFAAALGAGGADDGGDDGDGDGDGGQRREMGRAKKTAHRVLEALYYLDQTLSLAFISSRLLRVIGSDEEGAGEDMNNVQQLLLYMLNLAQTRGYRRYGQDCYMKRIAQGAYDSRAWQRVCTIKEFVHDATRKEINFAMWLNLTRGRSNAQAVVDYMAECKDVQFPDLHKDRHVFSFRNGIYLARVTRDLAADFQQQGDGGGGWEEAGSPCCDRFVPYGPHEAVVPQTVAACRYFDYDFPGHLAAAPEHEEGVGADDDWYTAIPTPHLQSIMDYQQFEPEVCRWIYALLGRLIYSVNELDRWQVMPYLKGQASSGKSTIVMNVCRNFFEPDDVGVLSNNMERKFGISALTSKYMFVAPEIKSDLQLEQAEFQSMVSGEAVQVAVKFQTAHSVEWSVPGIMAGNEVPGWVDNAGSIGRRVVLFEFMRKVENGGDTELGKKLEAV